MTEPEAIRERHIVRQHLGKPPEPDVLTALRAEADACNRESGLHIQPVTNEPKAFEGSMARYGKFSGVTNYFALMGRAPERITSGGRITAAGGSLRRDSNDCAGIQRKRFGCDGPNLERGCGGGRRLSAGGISGQQNRG